MPAHVPHELELLRSDGDPKFWPPIADPDSPGQQGCYFMTRLDEEASIQWRTKIGAHVAKHLKLPDGPKYILKDWPEGYMLFVHCKGNRRDKYLYGRMDIRYRSAAEFMPHADWLCTTEQPARTCSCRYCLRNMFDERSVQGGENSHNKDNTRCSEQGRSLGKSTPRCSAKSTPSVSSRASRRSHSNPPIRTSTPKKSADCPRDSLPADGAKTVLACVRVAVSKSLPSADGALLAAVPWPTMHELVWCKLQHPIVWVDVVIDFWPGIIKAAPLGQDECLVTLLGNIRDVRVSLQAMVPYQAHRVEEATIRKLQPTRRKRIRAALLDLEEYGGTVMDDSRFSTISSAFLFAISFSVHLATMWSWTANSEITGPVSASTRSLPRRYALRSQKHKEERYGVLWWGPERIEERQLVQLKMSPSAIFTNPDTPTASVFTAYPTGLDQPIFLQIHSMFYRQKPQKKGDHLVGPVVAGMIFDLVDESQYEPVKNLQQDLPSSPSGTVFRPLLKESYEIVLPVTAISNRYYWRIAEESTSKHNPLKPITFRATRAKMLEYAYEMSRKRTHIPGGSTRDDQMGGISELAG